MPSLSNAFSQNAKVVGMSSNEIDILLKALLITSSSFWNSLTVKLMLLIISFTPTMQTANLRASEVSFSSFIFYCLSIASLSYGSRYIT